MHSTRYSPVITVVGCPPYPVKIVAIFRVSEHRSIQELMKTADIAKKKQKVHLECRQSSMPDATDLIATLNKFMIRIIHKHKRNRLTVAIHLFYSAAL